jgi:hypothetical protein
MEFNVLSFSKFWVHVLLLVYIQSQNIIMEQNKILSCGDGWRRRWGLMRDGWLQKGKHPTLELVNGVSSGFGWGKRGSRFEERKL